jgi:hypothetical protein
LADKPDFQTDSPSAAGHSSAAFFFAGQTLEESGAQPNARIFLAPKKSSRSTT